MIIFDNVSKTYGNGVKGLDHINLTIEDGEFVSIIGLSGAGKSTLLRSINRLNDVSEGEITINGESVTKAVVHLRHGEDRDRIHSFRGAGKNLFDQNHRPESRKNGI